MNYKKLKKEKEEVEKLLEMSLSLQRLANMNVEQLLTTLHEIGALTEDKLLKWIIRNAIERHELDKLCQNRVLIWV